MKLFSLLVSLLFLLPSLTFQTVDKDLTRLLDRITNETQRKIQESLQKDINEIKTKLQDSDKTVRDKIIQDLTPFYPMILAELAEKNIQLEENNKRIEKFVNEEIIPNHISSNFFCAWNIISQDLSTFFKENNVAIYKPKLAEINDFFRNVTSDKMTKIKPLSEREFIKIMKFKAPKLNGTGLIEIAAVHALPSYKYQGKEFPYYETVLLNFIAWKDFLCEGVSLHRIELIKLFKIRYGNNWQDHIDAFSLIQARNDYIGNFVKHYFWNAYSQAISEPHNKLDFEEILDENCINGWYFTEEHLEYFNTILRVVHETSGSESHRVEPYFENFIGNPEIGVPQSGKCRYSKRDLKYYMNRWLTSTSPLN